MSHPIPATAFGHRRIQMATHRIAASMRDVIDPIPDFRHIERIDRF